MGGFTFGAWATLGTAGQSIAASSSNPFGAISNAGKVSTEVSVSVTYGSGAVAADLQIERDVDGTNYEGMSSAPWVVSLPAFASGTRQRVITVPADMTGDFQVRVVNSSAAAITVTVRTRQSTYSAT